MLTREQQEQRVMAFYDAFGVNNPVPAYKINTLWNTSPDNASQVLRTLMRYGYFAKVKRGVYVLIKKLEKNKMGC